MTAKNDDPVIRLQHAIDNDEPLAAPLKEYALAQHRNESIATFGNYMLGIYYLTLARWFEPQKYELAQQVMGWLD